MSSKVPPYSDLAERALLDLAVGTLANARAPEEHVRAARAVLEAPKPTLPTRADIERLSHDARLDLVRRLRRMELDRAAIVALLAGIEPADHDE